MYLVAIAWIYVVVMMALAEGLSPQGSWLGAFFTLLLYGALPLGIVMYLLGTPARRRARRQAEASAGSAASPTSTASAEPSASAAQPDRGSHPPGDPVAPVRKEP